jgi:hypothetical protein
MNPMDADCDDLPAADSVSQDDLAGLKYDAGVYVSGGTAKGSRILYKSDEPFTPVFGPPDGLPPFQYNGSSLKTANQQLQSSQESVVAVGEPINMQPRTDYSTPVNVRVRSSDRSRGDDLIIYRDNGTNWVQACDSDGNILPGGEGWMVADSREDNSDLSGSAVDIQVNYAAGIQLAYVKGEGVFDGCFIATAAYGSKMDAHVRILREVRDRILMVNSAGRRIVSFYYKYSPPIADFIAGHEYLRAVVRWSMLPIVGAGWIALKLGLVPAIALMAIFGIGLIGFAWLRRFGN